MAKENGVYRYFKRCSSAESELSMYNTSERSATQTALVAGRNTLTAA